MTGLAKNLVNGHLCCRVRFSRQNGASTTRIELAIAFLSEFRGKGQNNAATLAASVDHEIRRPLSALGSKGRDFTED
jgi:hypothetical protein